MLISLLLRGRRKTTKIHCLEQVLWQILPAIVGLNGRQLPKDGLNGSISAEERRIVLNNLK